MARGARKPRRQISEGRKGLYYGGMALMAIGFIIFISGMISAVFDDGPKMPSASIDKSSEQFQKEGDEWFDASVDKGKSMMLRAFLGMGLIVAGGVMMKVGHEGPAGAGLVLDPEQAREDVEPWSRMKGGTISDALEEVDVVHKLVEGRKEEVVKVRCKKCRGLNDEDAKFCDQCGEPL